MAIQWHNGKILWGPSGIAFSSDCCCDVFYKLTPCLAYGTNCEFCSVDETPKYMTVDFTGVGILSGCCACNYPGSPSSWWEVPPESPNGSRILTQVSSCFWMLDYDDISNWRSSAGTNNCGVYGIDLYNTYTRIALTKLAGDRGSLSVIPMPNGVAVYLDTFDWTGCSGATSENEYIQECDNPAPQAGDCPGGIGGSATITAGNTASSCPGGSAFYTHTDLSAYVGGVVLLEEPGTNVWYTVTQEGDTSDGAVTVIDDDVDCETACAT